MTMIELTGWLREYKIRLEAMSNAELFQETIEAQGHCHNRGLTNRDWWRAVESLRQLNKRLEAWLGE